MQRNIILEQIKGFLDDYPNPQTKKFYSIAINKFFEHIQEYPKDYIKDIRRLGADLKLDLMDQYQKDITSFQLFLINSKLPAITIYQYVSPVKQMFCYYDIDFQESFWMKRRPVMFLF